MIFVYDDAKHNQYSLFRCLQDADMAWRICAAADILGGMLTPDDILIMPGGADLFYCEKLNGDGNRIIRDFVEQGGCYIGICAGAYYGAKRLDWDKGSIDGSRELAFYHGTAAGPVFDFIEDGDITKSWRKTITLRWADGSVTASHYQAGPVFTPDAGCEAEVLARYEDLPGHPAAIVKCRVGQGVAILSGSHIEVTQERGAQEIYTHQNPSVKRDLQENVRLCKKDSLIKIIEEVI